MKPFTCNRQTLISFIDDLKSSTGRDPKLESQNSQLIAKFVNRQKLHTTTTSADLQSPNIESEAEAVSFVNETLDDVVANCNAILWMISGSCDVQPAHLIVRPEMSIFSNRCDHAVVFDSVTNVPILCVETKKFFDEKFLTNKENRCYGQAYDQLKAMHLKGQPSPLGALTCFNETYFTCLDDKINWDSLPTLQSLRETIAHLPGTQAPKTTPSPLKVETARPYYLNDEEMNDNNGTFVADTNRCLVRSAEHIKLDCLVPALVVLALNALQGNYEQKPWEVFSMGAGIQCDCIEMSDDTYQWGKLTTKYKGHHTKLPPSWIRLRPDPYKNLYLLQCIGTGSTSKVYHAMTKDGHDCVVKLYVKEYDEEGNKKSKKKFQKESKDHVKKEVKYYETVYKDELKDYVWQRQLFGRSCIILPFFHPIPVHERENAIPDITSRLTLFTKHQLAFHDSDQSWRHIGRFNGQLYLFDLGDLQHCGSKIAAQECASSHVRLLMR
jgi:hypothetical protein